MSQTNINTLIAEKIQNLSALGQNVGESFKSEAVKSFKEELKNLKEWTKFIDVHLQGHSIKLNDKIKKLYNIAGALNEAYEAIAMIEEGRSPEKDRATWNKSLENAQKEWSKHFSNSLIQKLEKQFTEPDYSKIPTQLINNFCIFHWNKSILEETASA